MKLVKVKSDIYIDFDKKNTKEDPKFHVGDHVRISKYKSTFAKIYQRNWSEEDFVIIKVKILFRGHMLLIILQVKKLLEPFTIKNCKCTMQKKLGSKK